MTTIDQRTFKFATRITQLLATRDKYTYESNWECNNWDRLIIKEAEKLLKLIELDKIEECIQHNGSTNRCVMD